MSRRYNRRRGGRGPVIHVHNNNQATANAKSRSDACMVAFALILTVASSLVAICVFFPPVTGAVAGTGLAYAANMIRQQV